MSVLNINRTSVPEWRSGKGLATVTPAPIGSGPLVKGVTIKADSGNTAPILVAPRAVGAAFKLDPGATSPLIAIDDLSKLFISSVSGSQAFSWVAA